MATMTLGINQQAQMAAKAMFDKMLKEFLEAGIDKEEAVECAKMYGASAYDAALVFQVPCAA